MSDKSAIEWTDATWNPVTGCSKVSPGCAYCYAERLSLRFRRSLAPWTPDNAAENVILHPDRIQIPLHWREPRMVFVNSMSDLFHELVPDEFIDQVFATMKVADRHTFQVLSKRPERMKAWFEGYGRRWAEAPLSNVWVGTTIENDRWVARADLLRAVPATVRFVSAEPLLGPLPSLDLSGLDWLIVGGESGGPKHRRLVAAEAPSSRPVPRPESVAWVRDLRDRCVRAGVPFFFKQWGGAVAKSSGR